MTEDRRNGEVSTIETLTDDTGVEGARTILVCQSTGCVSSESPAVYEALEEAIVQSGLEDLAKVKLTGCMRFCQKGPIVVVQPEGTAYLSVKVEDVPEIVETHLKNGGRVERLLYTHPTSGESVECYDDIPFVREQERILLRNCGRINPEAIEEYTARGGYEALRKALTSMTPIEIVEQLKLSGLRGRGGGGFPTGRKWEAGLAAEGDEKYIVCNADEGDPGAFIDGYLLESDPHSVIEGMIIAGYTIGAHEGYVYVRAEYPMAVKRLRLAVSQARSNGFLGKNILGSGFDFDIVLFRGAGAFVCGESTALTQSIEGNRGMPKATPRPRTTEEGLFDKPTVLNNVKTFSYVPQIVERGGEWFASIGTENSPGTAAFALTGMIQNSGMIEVPMGTTLRKIIFDVGGGISSGRDFKAVQTGGPSGGCIPASYLDTPVDFDSLKAAGSIMGSGGMVVMDTSTCMVDVARFFLDFTQKESCGQCTICKLGTMQMLSILEDIVAGKGQTGDIELLLDIGRTVNSGSLCGLGQTAANPVLTTIRYFRDEYQAHIEEKRCPALVCKELISYHIDPERCTGCTACARACPVSAISGERKQVHVIDQDVCIRCGVCLEKCPDRYHAVDCISGHLSEGDQ